MAENQDLLRAVLANPDADEPRLAYAAWCDRQPDDATRARGEFIRLQIELSAPEAEAGDRPEVEVARSMVRMSNENRVRDLIRQYAPTWAEPVASLVTSYSFDRGFIAEATLSASHFLANAERLFQRAPIFLVKLTDTKPVADSLLSSPLLSYVRALNLENNGLEGNDLILLTKSPYLSRLWWLDLRWNNIDFDGVKRLAGAEKMKGLVYLGLAGNPCDPMETVGVEGYTILAASLPEEGEALEALYGYIPWIHYQTDSIFDHPPNPLRPPPRR